MFEKVRTHPQRTSASSNFLRVFVREAQKHPVKWWRLITCKDIWPRRHSSIFSPLIWHWSTKSRPTKSPILDNVPENFKNSLSAINLSLTHRKPLAALQNGNRCSFFTQRGRKTKRISDGREWWIRNIGFFSSSVCDFQCPNFASHKSM